VLSVGSPIFMVSLLSERQYLLVVCADMLNKEPPWCEGETCLACNARFGITTRRHHWLPYYPFTLLFWISISR